MKLPLSQTKAKKIRHAIDVLLDEELALKDVKFLLMARSRSRYRGQEAQAEALGISLRMIQRYVKEAKVLERELQ